MQFQLGIPVKIVYRATLFRSDLTDVHSIIMRPDGRQLFMTLEEMDAPFNGVYVGILNSELDDPVGDWLVKTTSQTDGNRSDMFRVTMVHQPARADQIQELTIAVQNMIDLLQVITL